MKVIDFVGLHRQQSTTVVYLFSSYFLIKQQFISDGCLLNSKLGSQLMHSNHTVLSSKALVSNALMVKQTFTINCFAVYGSLGCFITLVIDLCLR